MHSMIKKKLDGLVLALFKCLLFVNKLFQRYVSVDSEVNYKY